MRRDETRRGETRGCHAVLELDDIPLEFNGLPLPPEGAVHGMAHGRVVAARVGTPPLILSRSGVGKLGLVSRPRLRRPTA